MRWIALHLPLLSLETFAATVFAADAPERPLAIVDAERLVAAADARARALGIQPGQKRATALALAPQVVLGQADAARDREAVTAVAHAALAFTPMVALQPPSGRSQGDHAPDTVLLEVQSTLRLHGGLDALLGRLGRALAPLKHRVNGVDAPTAAGAALLARVHRRLHCEDRRALHAALDAAPVWLLGPGREHWDALQGMALHTLSDLRRLPRSGVARRFSAGLLDELDRAYGDKPDPREPVVLPPAYASRVELHARADTTEQVLHGAAVLLARLVAWLGARHAQARRFTLTMHHEPRWRRDTALPSATPLPIALAEPSRDAKHLMVLLRERLAALPLPAPTIELSIACTDIALRPAPSGELFATPGSEREGLVRLVERLQARLGAEQVQRLEIVADHRPERATVARPAAAAAVPSAARGAPPPPIVARATRPVWLIDPPEPLGTDDDDVPRLGRQTLELLAGPERIESGWWDGEPALRDYFIAQDAHGALVWVFRDRLPRGDDGRAGWYLQGALCMTAIENAGMPDDLHLLDNIFWHAFTGAQAAFAVGSGGARRYRRGLAAIAGFADPANADLAALAPHCEPGEPVYAADWDAPVPAGWKLVVETQMDQMVWGADMPPERDTDAPPIVVLGEADAAQMVALAELTHPGPFGPQALALGAYLGVRDEGGRLIAMAGERLRAGTLREVSGVCTHPEAQGRGLARLLMLRLVREMLERGETPFLHVMASNAQAAGLYERMGFRRYRRMPLRVVARSA